MPVENLDYLKPGPDPEKLVNKKVTLKAHFLKRRSTFLFSEEFMHLQYSDIVFFTKNNRVFTFRDRDRDRFC